MAKRKKTSEARTERKKEDSVEAAEPQQPHRKSVAPVTKAYLFRLYTTDFQRRRDLAKVAMDEVQQKLEAIGLMPRDRKLFERLCVDVGVVQYVRGRYAGFVVPENSPLVQQALPEGAALPLPPELPPEQQEQVKALVAQFLATMAKKP